MAAPVTVTVPGVPVVPPKTASLKVVQTTLLVPSNQTVLLAVVFQLPDPSTTAGVVVLSASNVSVAADAAPAPPPHASPRTDAENSVAARVRRALLALMSSPLELGRSVVCPVT